MPNWLHRSWWIDSGFELGTRWGMNHPRGTMWFTYGLCLTVVTLALAQAASHWHGLRSALSVGIGITVGLTLMTVGARQLRRQSAAWDRTSYVANLLGALAVIPTLVIPLSQVDVSGAVLGIAQGFADGYLAAQFGTLIYFVQRPKPEARRR